MARHILLSILCLWALGGCTTKYHLVTEDDGQAGDMSGDGDGDLSGDGDGDNSNPTQVCRRGGLCQSITAAPNDKVDLLLMVDNSSSMAQEQASVSEQLPRFLRRLTTGDRDDDGVEDFRPAKELHVGVVSSDLGLPGLESAGIQDCVGLGDNGVLQSTANPELNALGHCSTTQYTPPYLSFNAGAGDDVTQLANDLSCLATLGVGGCGFEQQLESALKAVWPAADGSVTFVGDAMGFGTSGNSGGMSPNGNFIREDYGSPSLVAIMLITDEEDCSSRRLDHFVPSASPNGLNTRCYYESQREDNALFPVERYIESFKKLRPGREDLVLFTAIVGVPPHLVTPEIIGDVDFANGMESDAFYDGILEDPQMQETIDTKNTPSVLEDDGLVPSCDRGETARAYPPRRIVKVAKAFGEHGVVQSICQDDFTQPFDAITDRIAAHLGERCLDVPLERDGDRVACDVIWELPAHAVGGSPTACDQRAFLTDAGETPWSTALCKVDQVAVSDGEVSSNGEGFYYDDFSDDAQHACQEVSSKTRIAFTPAAQPQAGVKVWLDCD